MMTGLNVVDKINEKSHKEDCGIEHTCDQIARAGNTYETISHRQHMLFEGYNCITRSIQT